MTIFKKENGFKQFLALLVVLTLICPSVLSAKKTKHGAWLKVTMQDSQVVDGELLTVKDNEIVLMSISKSGVTIPLDEITMIKYKKKGKFGTGFAIGIGISMILGGLVGGGLDHGRLETISSGAVIYGGLYGIPIGCLFGFFTSGTVKDKIYIFENASSTERSMTLKKLKSLARF